MRSYKNSFNSVRQKMRLVNCLVVLMFVMGEVTAAELIFAEPSVAKNQSGLAIVKRNKQHIGIKENGYYAFAAMAIIPASFSSTLAELRKLLKERFGEVEYSETLIQEHIFRTRKIPVRHLSPQEIRKMVFDQPIVMYEHSSPVLKRIQLIRLQGFQRLRKNNINLELFKQVQAKSKRYNKLDESQYSELELVILDGNEIFGMNSTIVAMSRHDTIMEWGFGQHSFWPQYADFGTTVVTVDAAALVRTVAKKMNKRVAIFPMSNATYFVANAGTMLEAQHWLKENSRTREHK